MKFNMPIDKYNQLASNSNNAIKTEMNSPIVENETMEPCLRGLQKINNNQALLNAVRKAIGVEV